MMIYLAMRWRALADEEETGKRKPRTAQAPPLSLPEWEGCAVTKGAELRAEAQRMRRIAFSVTDGEVLEEILLLIQELERRARLLTNGDAAE
jgi:hypothetical protein